MELFYGIFLILYLIVHCESTHLRDYVHSTFTEDRIVHDFGDLEVFDIANVDETQVVSLVV